MAARAIMTTKEYLINVPLPNYQGRYTVISHQHIIDTTMKLLANNGLVVERELYKTGKGGDIAVGKYHITDSQDPEMRMMFAWGNSYNKQMRFKCAIGGHLIVSDNSIIADDLSSFGRKHMGNALQECTDAITQQIINAKSYYSQLLKDKQEMKDFIISPQTRAEVLGRILFEKEFLTLNQMGEITHEIKKPSYDYNADKNSVWVMYNHILTSLKKAHPKHWIDQQRQIHWFLCSVFGFGKYANNGGIINQIINTPVKNIEPDLPNQLDLLDAIKDVETGMINDINTISEEVSAINDADSIVPDTSDIVIDDEQDGDLTLEEIEAMENIRPSVIEDLLEDHGDELTTEELAQIEANIQAAKADRQESSDDEIDFNL